MSDKIVISRNALVAIASVGACATYKETNILQGVRLVVSSPAGGVDCTHCPTTPDGMPHNAIYAATATDRYTIARVTGHARLEDGTAQFDAVLDAKELTQASKLAAFKTAGCIAIEHLDKAEYSAGRVLISGAEGVAGVAVVPGSFPPVDRLLPDSIDELEDVAAGTMLNPRYLARVATIVSEESAGKTPARRNSPWAISRTRSGHLSDRTPIIFTETGGLVSTAEMLIQPNFKIR